MTNNTMKFKASRWCSFVGALALICAASVVAMAQTTTPGGTVISNTATATYSDAPSGGTDFTTTSNTVTVTVTDISGLAITPDAGTRANVVRSQTGVDFLFTITNTGNITNQVVFKQAGASIILTGSASITAAVIDLDKDGVIDAGETDILANGADVTSAAVAQDGTLFVIVRTTISGSALGGSTINVQLGDAAIATPWDNQALVASAGDVVTATAGTNGQVEARGDISATLDNTGSVLLGPSGFPGAFGSGSNTNNDYTNRSLSTGIFVQPGSNTNASGSAIFINSVKNTGNADDIFTFTAPAFTAGFTVEVSVNGGTSYVDLSVSSPTLAVALNTTETILVRITAPSGKLVLTGFANTIRATSGTTPAANNETIDRLYTGYLSLAKSQTVANATGKGDGTLTDAVPGATIAYVVAYDNESLEDGGTNSSPLSARNIVLIDAMPANTDFKVLSGTTSLGGGITVAGIEYSNDNQVSWTYTPVSTTGGAPAGFDRTVTHVRFILTGAMAPADAAGSNGFTVRIR
ncbi:MAG TPA: hypothetical protein VE977_03985 [Pyrinomonadaceae bacterium]|nr:hypothetical protein [Pyrinomonadaceae bacterium]